MSDTTPVRSASGILGITAPRAERNPEELISNWLDRVFWYRPGHEYVPQKMENYFEAMGAYHELSGAEPGDFYRYDVEGEPQDWAVWLIEIRRAGSHGIRGAKEAMTGVMMDGLAESWSALPKTIPHSRLGKVIECDEVRPIIEKLCPLDEFAAVRGLTPEMFEIVWKTRAVKSGGAYKLGSMGPIPEEKRDLWKGDLPVPLFRLTLALPYWILATDQERERLIHHELCHADVATKAKPSTRPHAIEENFETIKRYGPRDQSHAELILAGAVHPRTGELLTEDDHAQLRLFTGHVKSGATIAMIDPDTGKPWTFDMDAALRHL